MNYEKDEKLLSGGGKMKKVYLSEKGKVFLGVCAGLSEYFGIDVSIVRLIFVISIFFGGTGILIYLILFAILPKKDKNEIIDVEPESIDGEKTEAETKIVRPWKNRMIAGVCAGLANYLKIDVSFVRLIFVLMSLGGGIGIILYLIFWLFFPNDDEVEN